MLVLEDLHMAWTKFLTYSSRNVYRLSADLAMARSCRQQPMCSCAISGRIKGLQPSRPRLPCRQLAFSGCDWNVVMRILQILPLGSFSCHSCGGPFLLSSLYQLWCPKRLCSFSAFQSPLISQSFRRCAFVQPCYICI